jgi:hypothetical protein
VVRNLGNIFIDNIVKPKKNKNRLFILLPKKIKIKIAYLYNPSIAASYSSRNQSLFSQQHPMFRYLCSSVANGRRSLLSASSKSHTSFFQGTISLLKIIPFYVYYYHFLLHRFSIDWCGCFAYLN